MNEIISGLYEAAQAGHWFAVVGLAATLLTTLIKRFAAPLAEWLPGSNRWIPVVLSFGGTVIVASGEAGGDWKRFAAIVAVGGLEAAITAIGLYHAVQPRKPKGDSGDDAPPTPNNTGVAKGIALNIVAGILFCLALSGCSAAGHQAQTQTAAVVAVSANEVLPLLEAEYTLDMKMEVDEVATAGGTREEAEAEVERIKREWAPTWDAWDAFAEAHGTWRAILLGGPGDAVKAAIHAREAYCHLQKLAPDLPSMPLTDCGGAK